MSGALPARRRRAEARRTARAADALARLIELRAHVLELRAQVAHLKTEKENSFPTYGGNGVRHMGKMGRVGEFNWG